MTSYPSVMKLFFQFCFSYIHINRVKKHSFSSFIVFRLALVVLIEYGLFSCFFFSFEPIIRGPYESDWLTEWNFVISLVYSTSAFAIVTVIFCLILSVFVTYGCLELNFHGELFVCHENVFISFGFHSQELWSIEAERALLLPLPCKYAWMPMSKYILLRTPVGLPLHSAPDWHCEANSYVQHNSKNEACLLPNRCAMQAWCFALRDATA